ncbi:MAG: hypothetical protein GX591_16620 [Planctomycetes bacterium]|nr:hypothetical protein [Planctomycetota bacterium]
MTDTIDILLDPVLAAALRRGGRDGRGAAALAVLGQAGRPEAVQAAGEPEPPAEPQAQAAEPFEAPPDAGEQTSAFDAAAEAAWPQAAETTGTHVAPPRRPGAHDAAPAPRGDVYIAHYYARLPGDTAVNPYTRLGGPRHHG